ncbi:hypothetical protein HDV03_001507 [Kappamyces sp. JEL0829]|nr:hypothetical protein HDV03_001507 [Kappamyces sp. JEL0829]
MNEEPTGLSAFHLSALQELVSARLEQADNILSSIDVSSAPVHKHLPLEGLSTLDAIAHIQKDIVPLLPLQTSPRYFGFVTGGTTAAALIADHFVSVLDQNVQVHLPKESVATSLEASTLNMCLELFGLDQKCYRGKTFTTGATASNILGIACAREWSLRLQSNQSVADVGLLHMGRLGYGFQILHAGGHACINKAASLLGVGRASVIDCSASDSAWDFDLEQTKTILAKRNTASCIVVSFGEVNTGQFCTQLQQLRRLADEFGAWIHIDGAFGLFALCSDQLKHLGAGAELADSICVDGHKYLNVPYDCGLYFCKSRDVLTDVFGTTSSYLSTSAEPEDTVASPLHVGIENSRRFRALPVYATLLAYGKRGYGDMVERTVALARKLAVWIAQSDSFELLNGYGDPESRIFNIVLFRSRLHPNLKDLINASGRLYVSPTVWNGSAAVRLAVSNYGVDVVRDFQAVTEVLSAIADPGEPLNNQ